MENVKWRVICKSFEMTNCVHENDAVNSMYTDINNIFYTYFVVQVSE